MIRSAALACLVLSTLAQAQPAVERPLDRVLTAVDAQGRVDYDRIAAQPADLEATLAAVAAQRPSALATDAHKTAFLINAYNAYVLARILNTNARHIERQDLFEDLFERPVRVAGMRMTLNQLEHGILRRQSQVDGSPVPRTLFGLRPARLDPRIHAALNCGAVSCPPLQRRAFRAQTLDRDLEAAFGAFAASPQAARRDGGRVILSSLFDWFSADFETGGRALGDIVLDAAGGRQDALRARLAGRSAEALRRDRSVRFAYDWTVHRR